MARIIDLESGLDLEKRLSSLQVDEEQDFTGCVINSTLDGVLTYDREYRYTLFNPAMERLTGTPASKVLGRVAWDAFPTLLELGTDRCFKAAVRGETLIEHEEEYSIPDTGRSGQVYRCHMPLRNEMGEIVGGLAVVRDVTERVRAMHELQRLNETLEARVRERTSELQSAVSSLQFLADAGTAIAASLEQESIVQTLGVLASRYFSGWCRVHLASDAGLGDAQVFHAEPAALAQMVELETRYPSNAESSCGPCTVLRSGKPQWSSQVFDSVLRDLAHSPEHLDLLRNMNFKSAICVPIAGHDRTWGVVTYLSNERLYTPSDLQIGLDLAARVGMALDLAYLFQENRRRFD